MAQVEGFKALFEEMATRPQDYVSDLGRLTTNTVEGFHGLALLYRDKKTDLMHTHYVCKTNMAVCHKVLYLETHKQSMYPLLVEFGSCVENILLGRDGCGHTSCNSGVSATGAGCVGEEAQDEINKRVSPQEVYIDENGIDMQ